jgi:hypothetical protein
MYLTRMTRANTVSKKPGEAPGQMYLPVHEMMIYNFFASPSLINCSFSCLVIIDSIPLYRLLVYHQSSPMAKHQQEEEHQSSLGSETR